MRFVISSIVFLILYQASFSQRGAKWLTGQGNLIDFTVTPTISYLECDSFKNSWMGHGASMICDKYGNILFETTPYFVDGTKIPIPTTCNGCVLQQ